MMTVTSRLQSDRQLELYVAEVINSFGATALVKITLDAVQGVDCRVLQARESAERSPWETNPLTILSLLTYCYSVGMYNPADIEDAIDEDPAISYLAARKFPTATVLRRFRREHRNLVRDSLVRVFERIWAVNQLGLNPSMLTSAEWPELLNRAGLDQTVLLDLNRLAEERILLALLWDGPAMRD